MKSLLLLLVLGTAAVGGEATRLAPTASPPLSSPLSLQSDLDAFMARVLARRDDNWKKLQQYILDEDERLQITGPDGSRLYGFHRQYNWFIRDRYFVRSPLVINGISISEPERARYESRWIEREKSRERRAARGKEDSDSPETGNDVPVSADSVQMDVVSGSLEPRFVSAAYFLRFRFDPGHYALAGREQLNGRDVLKIEYYPSKLFREGRSRPNRRVRERDAEVEEKMNKVSLVTLWIDPALHQIFRYTFDNMGLDFLPGRALVRIDEMKASMEMTQPFPDVWLPGVVEMGFGLSTALGSLRARYDVSYHDYRLAEVTSKVRPPP